MTEISGQRADIEGRHGLTIPPTVLVRADRVMR